MEWPRFRALIGEEGDNVNDVWATRTALTVTKRNTEIEARICEACPVTDVPLETRKVPPPLLLIT